MMMMLLLLLPSLVASVTFEFTETDELLGFFVDDDDHNQIADHDDLEGSGNNNNNNNSHECQTITDLVCSDDAFSLFCKLLEMTGFDQVLDDASITATVFAPNDDAFDTDDLKTMETIFASDENIEWVLLYHTILDQVISSTELDCGVRVLMANERDTRTICSVMDNTIYQKGAGNDNSNQDNSRLPEIIDFNIDACNGIVHVVNKIILPRKLPSNQQQQQHEDDETEDDKHHDDADHDDDDDDEHKPPGAHDGADDDDDIIDDDGMEEHTSTPTTQPTFAFPEEDPNFKDDDDDDHNNNHHSSDDNDDDHDNDHHSDDNDHHEEDHDDDHHSDDNDHHEEDHDDDHNDDNQHLQSPEPIEGKFDEAASCGDTIADIICNTDGFFLLCEAITMVGLADFLRLSEWTFFAPTDEAFEKLFETSEPGRLTPESMTDLLLFHVVEDRTIPFEALQCDKWLKMSNDGFTVTHCRGFDKYQIGRGNGMTGGSGSGEDGVSAVFSLQASPIILQEDVRACNGIIHSIDTVLLPPAWLGA